MKSTSMRGVVCVAVALVCLHGCGLQADAPPTGPKEASERMESTDPSNQAMIDAWQANGRELPHVARYRGNRRGAFSFTCDDGFRGQVANTLDILDPLGLKATFFIIPFHMENPEMADNMVTWDQVRDLHDAGHEIGTHGAIREKLHEATDERLDELVNGSRRLIVERAGIEPVSYAAPGGSRVDDRVAAVIGQHHPFIRKSAYLPDVTIVGYGNTDRRHWDDQATRRKLEAIRDDGGWAIAVVHAIVHGYAPFASKDEFRIHCQWLAAQEDIWVAPMGTIGRYRGAQQRAELTFVDLADGRVAFRLTTAAEPAEVYHVPLTVVIGAAGARDARAVTADGTALPTIVRDDAILVDVLPDGAGVTVTWRTD